MHLTVRCDGASRHNPGPAALGVVVERDGRVLEGVGEPLGVRTSNEAEYYAVLKGLELAAKHGAREVTLVLDSQLLERQLTGAYRVLNARLRPLHADARAAMARFDRVAVRWVPRAQNAAADALANRALDEGRAVVL